MFYHALTGNGGTTPTEDLSPVLLWKNSNPTAEFAPQTISLNLTDYAGVIIEFRLKTDSTKINTRLYAKKNEDVDSIFGAGSYHTKGNSNAARGVRVTDTGVTFDEGYGNMTLNNKLCIPITIYGVKDYVVEPEVSIPTVKLSEFAISDTSVDDWSTDSTCSVSISGDILTVTKQNVSDPGGNLYFNKILKIDRSYLSITIESTVNAKANAVLSLINTNTGLVTTYKLQSTSAALNDTLQFNLSEHLGEIGVLYCEKTNANGGSTNYTITV